ncbi:MAG: alpha/beta hydrolase, partial [Candidatus Rokuibacteriota bacterium]
ALDTWYVEESGPIALWRAWCDEVQGRPLDAGHFFPEEIPAETAEALNRFFSAKS